MSAKSSKDDMRPEAARVGRRTFLKQAGGLGATMVVGACSKDSWLARRQLLAEDAWIYGYPIVATVTSGGTLDLAYLTNQTSFVVRLWRWGSTPTLIYTSPAFAVTAAATLGPLNAGGDVATDWQWPRITLDIDPAWPAGVYLADFEAPAGAGSGGSPPTPYAPSGQALFVVRPTAPSAPVLYKLNLNTQHAYSDGPAGLAPGFYAETGRALGSVPDGNGSTHLGYRLTMLRPGGGTGGLPNMSADPYDATDQTTPVNTFAHLDPHFLKWFEDRGIAVDFCTDVDLHEQPQLLSSYRLLVTGGHDEYWSKEMRDHVDAFVASGGNVAFFSGNNVFWRVYFADDNGDGHVDAMVCNKQDASGAWSGGDGFDQWWKIRPENATTGMSARMGGWLWDPLDDNHGYTVQRTTEWPFAGTGLAPGSDLGSTARLIHYEFDGVDFADDGTGMQQPTGLDGTPPTFVLLGVSDPSAAANLGWSSREEILASRPPVATMGYFTGPGTVFNGGTTDWPRAMVLDATVELITRNVVTALSAERAVFALADSDGDGNEDIFYRVPFASGTAIGFWTLAGALVRSSGYVSMAQVPGWMPCAVADFDGDGVKDLLYHNSTTGQMAIWYLTGATRSTVATGAFVTAPTSAAGRPVAALDFNADGSPDLLFWDEPTGQVTVWFMSASDHLVFQDPATIDHAADAGMTLIAARDFNADGKPDLVFFNASTGQVTIWLLGGTTFVSAHTLTQAAPAGWRLVGAGDINGDGTPELLFQDAAATQLAAWFLSGNPAVNVVEQVTLPAAARR